MNELPISVNIESREVLLKATNEIFVVDDGVDNDLIDGLIKWLNIAQTIGHAGLHITNIGDMRIINVLSRAYTSTNTRNAMSDMLSINVNEYHLWCSFIGDAFNNDEIKPHIIVIVAHKLEPLTLK